MKCLFRNKEIIVFRIIRAHALEFMKFWDSDGFPNPLLFV